MANIVRDPVCGTEINLENAEERSEYEGETFYFCSDQCRNKFDEDPAGYARRASAAGGGEAPPRAVT